MPILTNVRFCYHPTPRYRTPQVQGDPQTAHRQDQRVRRHPHDRGGDRGQSYQSRYQGHRQGTRGIHRARFRYRVILFSIINAYKIFKHHRHCVLDTNHHS